MMSWPGILDRGYARTCAKFQVEHNGRNLDIGTYWACLSMCPGEFVIII